MKKESIRIAAFIIIVGFVTPVTWALNTYVLQPSLQIKPYWEGLVTGIAMALVSKLISDTK
jgi:uncharacterized membrane protein YvlD (DUF360 family)